MCDSVHCGIAAYTGFAGEQSCIEADSTFTARSHRNISAGNSQRLPSSHPHGTSRVSGWIKVDKNLGETIRFRRVVRKLRDSSNALRSVTDALSVTIVLGALQRFWIYADSHISDDNTLDITPDEINELVGVEGFAQALPADWLKVLDTDQVQLPDFVEHNGSSEKQRRDNARRQAEYRHRHKSHNVTRDVTPSNTRNDARPDQTRPEEIKRVETSSLPPAAAQPAQCREFADLKSIFPRRAGSQPWDRAQKAVNARLREGHSWNEILEGARRYAAFVRATGKEHTESVLQASTFVGPSKHFLNPYDLPATKADARLAGNLSAADEFMRRTESTQ